MNKEIKFDKNLIIIIILFIVVFVLGFLGWMEFYENIDREVSNLRITVLTAGLFYKNIFWPIVAEYMGIAEYNIPVLLNIARLTAPLLLAYTVFFVIISIFKKTALIYFYRWFKKDYTIIIGYNERVHSFINNSIKKEKDSKQNKEKKQRFVLFTGKDNIPLLEEKRLIIFDNEKEIMKKVMKLNPFKAKNIIFWNEDDKKNKENLSVFWGKIQNTKVKKDRYIDCFIYLGNSYLIDKIKELPLDTKVKIHPFNIEKNIASIVVDNHTPDAYKNLYNSNKNLNISIIGFGNLGYSIFMEILQMNVFLNMKRLKITLIDKDIQKKKMKFFSRYNHIAQLFDIKTVEYDHFLQDPDQTIIPNLDLCFTCIQDQMENDYISKKVYRYYKDNKKEPKIVQIIYKMDKLEKTILSDSIKEENEKLNINTFDSDQIITYNAITLQNEKKVKMAEKIQYFYNELIKKQNQSSNKSKVKIDEWEELNDHWKEENIYAARHLFYKMKYINHEIVPDDDKRDAVDITELEDKTLELLAKIEHQRWSIRKYINGYIPGNVTEKAFRDTAKIHKDLVDWDELTSKEKEKDYISFVNEEILKEAGLKIVKIEERGKHERL